MLILFMLLAILNITGILANTYDWWARRRELRDLKPVTRLTRH